MKKKATPKVEFVPSDGSRISKAEAKTVGRALEGLLRAHHGVISAEMVLEYAAPLASPLHKFFEWDDREAAQQFRLEQARGLIRQIHIIRIGGDGKASKIRAIRHIDGQGYMRIDDIMQNADHRENLLRRFRAEAVSMYVRWAMHRDIGEGVELVMGAIEKAGFKEPTKKKVA